MGPWFLNCSFTCVHSSCSDLLISSYVNCFLSQVSLSLSLKSIHRLLQHSNSPYVMNIFFESLDSFMIRIMESPPYMNENSRMSYDMLSCHQGTSDGIHWENFFSIWHFQCPLRLRKKNFLLRPLPLNEWVSSISSARLWLWMGYWISKDNLLDITPMYPTPGYSLDSASKNLLIPLIDQKKFNH